MRLVISFVVVALTTLACAASSGSDPSDDPTVSAGPGRSAEPSDPLASGLRPVTPGPASPGTGTGSLSAAILDPIVADAATRSGVPASEVIVVRAEPKAFPDGGLGCPLPGMVYTQVIVDGYQVVVQAGQQTYDYRGTGPDQFRLCSPTG